MPKPVRALARDLEVRITDWPDQDQLDSVGVRQPVDLLGLFEGLGFAQGGDATQTGTFPNRVWLFMEPILHFWAEGEDPLDAVIRHVLVHEIGHHFGLSDDDMAAIDDGPDETDALDGQRPQATLEYGAPYGESCADGGADADEKPNARDDDHFWRST